MNITDKARTFSVAAHAAVGQRRKYTGEPYSVHPVEVAGIVSTVTGSESIIAAALLHDVLEDTQVTHDLLVAEFGAYIADLVLQVTDVSRPEDGNRAVRKAKDCEHIAQASPAGQTIKLADLISNTTSIVARDPEFARVYLLEKQAMLDVLTAGHRCLQLRARTLLIESAERIGLNLRQGS